MIRPALGPTAFLFFLLTFQVGLFSAWAEPYIVQKGDTATSVARGAQVTFDALQRANPGVDLGKLRAGQALALPLRHVVAAGETLYSLAKAWGLDQGELLKFNGLSAGTSSLKKGQVLYYWVPAGVPSKGGGQTAVKVPDPVPEKPVPKPSPKAPADGANPAGPGPFWPVAKTPKASGDKLKSVTFDTAGEEFRSVSSGTVVFAGEFRGVGRVLLVQGADQRVFAYGNFESASVEFGSAVKAGQVLGRTSSRSQQKLQFFAFLQSEPLDVFTAKR